VSQSATINPQSHVQLKDVRKRYGTQQVVHGVSADINKGEFVVVVGPSGCGKSTLLRMVAGLEEISEGEIVIGGRRVNDLEPKDRDIAMVFQNYALYPHMSVYDNMAYGLKIRGMPRAEIEQRVNEAARILALEALLQRKPRELSGGQRQRVAMGRAIVRQPQVFLFDEPLSNLDAKLRVQMRLELQKLHARLGVTSLYVTHDQVEAMTLGSRIIVMNAGRVEQIGTPAEVYHQPETLFVASFIGSPPMNLIKGTLSDDGGSFRTENGDVRLPVAATAAAGRAVVLGLRPEQLHLHAARLEMPTPTVIQMQVQVEMVESLGADHLIHCRLGGQDLVVRTGDESMPAAGATIGLGFDAQAVHWFDAETTRRIATP
jgi:sn-glycerol 3-phosphate transport system ATP-binding protein